MRMLELLLIPQAFREHMGAILPEIVMRTTTNYSWKVKLRVVNGRLAIDQGWAGVQGTSSPSRSWPRIVSGSLCSAILAPRSWPSATSTNKHLPWSKSSNPCLLVCPSKATMRITVYIYMLMRMSVCHCYDCMCMLMWLWVCPNTLFVNQWTGYEWTIYETLQFMRLHGSKDTNRGEAAAWMVVLSLSKPSTICDTHKT